MTWRFIVSLLFAILVSLFAIQNSSVVPINFFFAEFNVSQALVILISVVIGSIIIMLLEVIRRIKLNHKIKGLNKTIQELEEQNSQLKQKVEELSKPQTELSSTIAEGQTINQE